LRTAVDSYYFPEQEDDLGLLAEELGAAEPNHFHELRLVVGFNEKIPVIEGDPLMLLELRRLVAASHIPGVCRSRRWKSSPHIESAGFNIELRSKFLFSRSLCTDDRARGIGDCPLLLLLLELPAVLSRCCSLSFSLSK